MKIFSYGDNIVIKKVDYVIPETIGDINVFCDDALFR